MKKETQRAPVLGWGRWLLYSGDQGNLTEKVTSERFEGHEGILQEEVWGEGSSFQAGNPSAHTLGQKGVLVKEG